ncbi:MAG TPA: 16S rRNA (adenine(1518)-N(6)/adenine(1519)-N(6))-dimethyltransferase RsmA [Candidatus Methanoculleus thermohydrogenotrophicum]|jgi:16S rRNA (adenine1518-N6/adenine1519-N6)-dimethyltransferase|nr:16S rRNA (adenine(1518)-N(6)/adenine(1519)-N(6))-dimethyltransferase RsmA [Candidatus Methanoculleus thermohydrogenotrophicum]NLM82653.1 16S ribosomal RNA methyltransferase A [Candidatus Methanoculleus thermohydrogenotrophicum]HOB18217.1 16S rRNA (adenine(1518)-N(6)/adenine(1519)-N(6))-dimethyltransferase RsmA [Candidatus Methanoculleus thermohydrogenotrophicum]HPZ37858.1 16S rRNA (adenine(1518)-N(6)/adenine(1519)-N(6))-dimethyltransferase RsmA [Candidatus Methanoculleus thermohydrogenotrophi
MSAPRDQHFLIDQRAVEKIAGFVDVSGRRVLEIGPGEGVLTRALLDRGARVVAVEIDPALVDELELLFADEIMEGRLEVIPGDATKVDLPPFDIVVANLPYSASSKITFRLLESGFEVAVLMYQKEFARRMIAQPGTPGVGRLSVMVQTYASVKPLLELSPNSFRPKPQVRSWVVRITPHEPPYPLVDRQVYADVVRVLFSHRRKTIRKGLRSGKGTFEPEAIERAIAGLPDDLLRQRPEDLMLEEFALIANRISRCLNDELPANG